MDENIQTEAEELLDGENDSMYLALRAGENKASRPDPIDRKCRRDLKRDIRAYFKCTNKEKASGASEDGQILTTSPDGKRREGSTYSSWTVRREQHLRKQASSIDSLDSKIKNNCQAADFWSVNQRERIIK